jgi:hypothetical protein
MGKNRLQPQDIVFMYTVQHLTCAEIAKIASVSRQWVWRILKAQNITSEQGERVNCNCDFCGISYTITRKKWRTTTKHYCSTSCYHAALINPHYSPDRYGQAIARKIVKQYFNLQPHHVVHHIDGNCRNNDLSNLMVFDGNGTHVKYHRGCPNANPLWEGAKAR